MSDLRRKIEKLTLFMLDYLTVLVEEDVNAMWRKHPKYQMVSRVGFLTDIHQLGMYFIIVRMGNYSGESEAPTHCSCQ